MKKNTIYSVFACALMFTACDETNFEVENQIPEQFHKILYLKESGKINVSLFDLPDDYTYSMTLVKGGSSINDTASAKLIVSSQEEITESYSNIEGINYQVIPEDCYKLSDTDIKFNEEESSKEISVAIHPQIVKNYMSTNSEDVKWVLPLVVTSESDSINANRSELFLMLDEVITPSVGFVNTILDKGEYQYGRHASISEMVQFRLDFENQWDINCQFTIDNNYIDSYNSTNQTDYKPVPDDLISITNSISLPKGTSAQLLPVEVSDISTLPAGDYMIPVKIYKAEPFEASNGNDLFVLTFSVTYIIDRSNWTATASSEHSPTGVEGPASNVLDGDPGTYWHSKWSDRDEVIDNPPYELIIDTHDDNTYITKIGLLKRLNYINVFKGEFFASSDNSSWISIGKFRFSWVDENGELAEGAATEKYNKEEYFPITPTRCRYFKIKIEKSDLNPAFSDNVAHMAEVYAYSEPEQ